MEAHRVQKSGKATEVAQPLEIREAAPAAHRPGSPACGKWAGSSASASAQTQLCTGPSITLLVQSSRSRLQTLRRGAFPEQATGPSPHF